MTVLFYEYGQEMLTVYRGLRRLAASGCARPPGATAASEQVADPYAAALPAGAASADAGGAHLSQWGSLHSLVIQNFGDSTPVSRASRRHSGSALERVVLFLLPLVVLALVLLLLGWYRFYRIVEARFHAFFDSEANEQFLTLCEQIRTYAADNGRTPSGDEYELFAQLMAGSERSEDVFLSDRTSEKDDRLPQELWVRKGDAVLPVDPWGHRYRYRSPGRHLPDAFDLYSVGPNGTDEGGTGDDLANWRIRPWLQWTPVSPLRPGGSIAPDDVKLDRSLQDEPCSLGLPDWTWDMYPVPELLTILTIGCVLWWISLVFALGWAVLEYRQGTSCFSDWSGVGKAFYLTSLSIAGCSILLLLLSSMIYEVR